MNPDLSANPDCRPAEFTRGPIPAPAEILFCLGAQFARRELRTFLRRLVDQVASIEPAGDAEWAQSHFVSGVKHLPIHYRWW